MAVTDFESELNLGTLVGTLRGGITSVTIKEKDAGATFQPSQIIRTDRDWQITLNWELVGTMLDSMFFTIPGNFVINAYLEGLGQNADEKDLSGDTAGGISVIGSKTVVPAGSLAGGLPVETEWKYSETITIRSTAALLKPGAYKLAVTLTYEVAPGTPGPIAGFIEIKDMVQIYKP